MSDENRKDQWALPASPPSPLFTNEPERKLVKQISDELTERVLGQQILYYPIDMNLTAFHPLYGESVFKSYLDPVHVYCLIEWEGMEVTAKHGTVDKKSKLKVHFHKRRLTEDQDLYVRIGDFVLYNERYYEIVSLDEPRQLYVGHEQHKVEISATCIRSRTSLFEGQ